MNLKIFCKNILLFYIFNNLCACLISFILLLFSVPGEICVLVELIIVSLIYIIGRKKIDISVIKTNTILLLLLGIVFSVLMLTSKGNISGSVVSKFLLCTLPFLPLFFLTIMDQTVLIYCTVFCSVAIGIVVPGILLFKSIRINKKICSVVAVLIVLMLGLNCYLTANRPEVRYAGHGFKYMGGYSSTDFKNYMVYSSNSKLVLLENEVADKIESESDMPVMDGAEACYPLYASVAKCLYKDIEEIELKYKNDNDVNEYNGKIVQFSNSVVGLMRLVDGDVDVFFGARPSNEQIEFAAKEGVELEVTPIGREAFVFFVEEDNSVENLSSDQVKDIYAGKITNWSVVGGNDQEIVAFQRPTGSGSQTMMEYFMGDIPLKDAKTYEVVSAMEGVIHKVAQYANEDGAIGYSFLYFIETLNHEKNVKILSINGVKPSVETIFDGSYPLTVPLCLITRKQDDNPNVRRVMDFMLSKDGQELVEKTGYAPLNK